MKIYNCRVCSGRMRIGDDGASHHLTADDAIDHDKDADHVAVANELTGAPGHDAKLESQQLEEEEEEFEQLDLEPLDLETEAEILAGADELDPLKPHRVWILFGASPESMQLQMYQYATFAELMAFLEGLDAGDGWMDWEQFDNAEAAKLAYIEAKGEGDDPA